MSVAELMHVLQKEAVDLRPPVELRPDEVYLPVKPRDFRQVCHVLHKHLASAVMMLFATDERPAGGGFRLYCAFLSVKMKQWIFVTADLPADGPSFDSMAKDMYSASLFEREIKEMFGIEPAGSPDARRLHLHDEVWPEGHFPLRKDFDPAKVPAGPLAEYPFVRVEGDGVFEVPVGPVHAGIIGPGHFRFSVAGEPIIHLGIRLGFTHRGVEKLFEKKSLADGIILAERVSGDSCFAHGTAFCQALERIFGVSPAPRAQVLRAVYLELERMYNHVNDIGGMAVDVGFSFPAALASVIKEAILQLNERLTGSRYLKGVNAIGGVTQDMDAAKVKAVFATLTAIGKDFSELRDIIESSVSFMDRADTTGTLKKKIAEDFGVIGLAARASGVPLDLRKHFPGVYETVGFQMMTQDSGDALARYRIRVAEFEESARMIKALLTRLPEGPAAPAPWQPKEGMALGFAEGWRGPVLYWVKTSAQGAVERCKVVDPSFHNWYGLAQAVLGDIIPDFPLCNKSFDLSYSGNDL